MFLENNIKSIILDAANKGLFLRVDNGKLLARGSWDKIDVELKLIIKNKKQEIISTLSNITSIKYETSISKRFSSSNPLSFAQQRLWLLDKIDGGNANYNLPSALRLSGDLNVDALKYALSTIIKRHESLRTFFIEDSDGQPLQVIRPASMIDIRMTDISLLPVGEREFDLAELVMEEANKPFDLSSDLMLRAQLVKVEDQAYILLVTMHHIASDGWSMAILINEFSALYQAYVQGEDTPLPELAIQYADYAQWQRDWLQGEVLDEQLGYWKTQLAALPVVHSLPLDKARPKTQTFNGSTYQSIISSSDTDKLNTLCHGVGGTLFMGLHAVFSVLLARYSNETDIVVGSPIANREQAEVADLIGFFVNTLVLRCDLSNNPSFTELLNQSKTTLLDAYAHQQVPFEQLVEVLRPERSVAHSPLFQVMLVLQNNEKAELALPGLALSSVEQPDDIAKYDLTLNVMATVQGLVLSWNYNSDLFNEETIARISKHFDLLFTGLVNQPEENVFSIDMLSQEETHQQLVEWNDKQADVYNGRCIHELFEQQVLDNPNAVAVVFEDSQLTYSELNQKSNQLAHYLIEVKEVAPDTLVGICLDRSLEMIVAIMGILKAGGAYMPLDPNYPEARLIYMLEDASLNTVITNSDVLVRTPITSAQALCLDDVAIQNQLSSRSGDNIKACQLGLNANHLAYVIYTSGSTGNSKGVMIEHGSLDFHIQQVANTYQIVVEDNVSQISSFSFDAATEQIFVTICAGATLNLCPERYLDCDNFVHWVLSNNLSVINLPPSYAMAVLPALITNTEFLCEGNLRLVIIGGEKFPVKLLEKWRMSEISAECQLVNAYGPTETCITSHLLLVNKNEHFSANNIGSLVGTGCSLVLGRGASVVPYGVIGELHIGGVRVARGYLNRPELTADKFIQNPFNSDPTDRLYKTGDLVRRLPDGNLEFMGRIDEQVKIRGFRIELGEVESNLLTHDDINDAVVIALEEGGDKRLVAYVVTNQEKSDDGLLVGSQIDAWRQHLGQNLPEYMVPSVFVVLDALPLTPNGKVDRKALPAPDMTQLQDIYVPPSTDTEKVLCEIWQDILGIDQVGVTDNFFRLGGHSLLLIQLLARLQEVGFNSDVRSLFDAVTLGKLAKSLDEAGTNIQDGFSSPPNLIPAICDAITPEMLSLINLDQSSIDTIVAAVPGGVANIQDIYPLAPLQEGILFHYQMSEGVGDAYVSPLLLTAKSSQQRDAFLQALQVIINRHDVLRTAILWQDLPQPVQVVYRHVAFPIEHLTLNPNTEVMPQLLAKMEIANQWMDITQGPLIRVYLAEDKESEQYFMLLQLHHIISDHVGLEIIQTEVQTILEGKAESLTPAAPYREFVAHTLHQAKTLDGNVFFQEKLGDISEPTTPFNLLDVHGNGNGILEASQILPQGLSQQIRTLSRQLAVSPAALFHTAFALVVGVCSGRDDVVFGTVLSGRLQGTEGAGRMLGLFINTLPYRLRLQYKGAEEVVLQAQAELLSLLPYEQASLSLAQQCSGLPNGTPLFSAMLNYRHSEPVKNDSSFDMGVEMINAPERSNYPFTVSVDDFGSDFALTGQVSASIDPKRVVAYLQAAMEGLVAAIEETPQKPILDIDILSTQERHQQLVQWNDSQTNYPVDKCIHELFEAQVKETPDAIALVFGNKQLTYQVLNEKSNQLAHYLIAEKGVKPDTLVGICLDRSVEMVIAILGTLKAGGAYVPLDPDYPEARLVYMLEDASLDTVITTSDVLVRTPISIIQAICLDEDKLQTKLSNKSLTNIAVDSLVSSHLAYVIYTSGSTGNPKGVMVEHYSVVRLVKNTNFIAYGEVSAIAQASNVSFDAATFEIWGALLNGARLVYVAKHELLNSTLLDQKIEQHGIDTLFITTALFNNMAEISPHSFSKLKNIFFGGEQSSIHSVRTIVNEGKLNRLVHVYGPTESTTFSTWKELELDYVNSTESLAIGEPLSNTTAYVVNENLQLQPVGTSGELLLGGDGLSRGYLNRPALTAEKFISNPFSDAINERLYKTGDLVRWLPDGNLEFMGRIDDQVKIRGFRIELGEIENSLLSHNAVKDAVVVAREEGVDKQLVAYVVTSQDTLNDALLVNAQIDAWREYLAQSLPDYMIPSAFVVLDSLPLTPNGKVDKKALPAPDMSQQQDSYVAPSTETEKILCEIWQDILGVELVGVTDNFFHLGGHSLLAVRMVAQLGSSLGAEVSVRSVFTYPSAKALAIFIDEKGQQVISALPAITPRQLDEVIPLALIQQSYWFLYRLEESGTLYNTPLTLRFSGKLNIIALEQALRTLVCRHENLRTRIVEVQSGPQQVVELMSSWFLPVVQTNATAVAALVEEHARKAFVLHNEAAFRVALFCIDTEDHVLNLVSHHAFMDGWSMDIMFRELSQLYDAFSSGNENPLPPLSIQYGDYSLWQHKHIKGDRYEQQCAYWKKQLNGLAPLLNLPTDHVRPAVQSYRGDNCPVAIPLTLSEQLSAYAQTQGVTLYHVLLGGITVLLSRYARTTNIPIGTAIANRPQQVLEELIGCFANTVVLRCDVQREHSFSAIVKGIRDTALDAFSHGDVPFDGVVEAVQPERSLGVPPIFQVMFRLHNQARGEGVEFKNLTLALFSGEKRETVELDLNISLIETPDGIQGEFAYATDLFDKATIERFITHYMQVLTEAMKTPSEPVANLALLSVQEQQQLTHWNDTQVEYPYDEGIHALFETSAKRLPAKLAYVCGDTQYSYQALNEQVNQLAHWLRTQGVGPEVRVGVCVGRTQWMGISLLAILKAGGTYVPLDAAYPKARLAHMVEVAKPSLILTEQAVMSRLSETKARTVCCDVENHLWADSPTDNPTPITGGEHSAYILFTSGTTGKPKGILVSHQSLRNMAVAHQQWQLLNEQARILQFASLSFSISIWGSFMAWAGGSTLYQVTDDEALPGKSLYQLLNNAQISTVTWPVSLLSTLPMSEMPESLTTIISSAEPCTDAVVSRWVEHGCRFLNMYGNSEVAIGSTMYEYHNSEQKLSIGRALPNTQMYLLDEQLQPVPVGVVAEIYTGGVGLAKGYVDNEEETAKQFIANPFDVNPFNAAAGSRLYKTGDLGRYLPSGEIEFIGRDDFQVSIRGFRIELTEVESVLGGHDEIAEVAVVARKDNHGSEQLVCYYVHKDRSQSVSTDELRTRVAKQLPSYMVPSLFVALDEMPLTPNRKVDRLALPTPDMNTIAQNEYVAPSTETEHALVEIWQDLLGLEKVSITDNFFHLGGHSLLALRLANKISYHFERHIEVTALFNAPTIREFSLVISNSQEDETPESCLRLMRSGDESQLPVYIVPGVGGSLLNMFELSNSLSTLGNVYGLQAVGLDDGLEPLNSVEDIALVNIEAMLAVQPTGHYRLVGHSFGGWIVFEMARQLKELGKDVSVVLLDSPMPSQEVNLQRQALAKNKDKLGEIIDSVLTLNNESDDFSAIAMDENVLSENALTKNIRHIAMLQSTMIYQPKSVLANVDILFVKALKQGELSIDDSSDWSSIVAEPLSFKGIESDHFGMLTGEHTSTLMTLIAQHFNTSHEGKDESMLTLVGDS